MPEIVKFEEGKCEHMTDRMDRDSGSWEPQNTVTDRKEKYSGNRETKNTTGHSKCSFQQQSSSRERLPEEISLLQQERAFSVKLLQFCSGPLECGV